MHNARDGPACDLEHWQRCEAAKFAAGPSAGDARLSWPGSRRRRPSRRVPSLFSMPNVVPSECSTNASTWLTDINRPASSFRGAHARPRGSWSSTALEPPSRSWMVARVRSTRMQPSRSGIQRVAMRGARLAEVSINERAHFANNRVPPQNSGPCVLGIFIQT